MSMDSLHKLFQDEIKDLYNAENQLLKALPKMAKKASSPALKQALTSHLAETKTHVDRLERIGKALGFKLTGKVCKAMEGKEVIDEKGDPSVLDAALIGAAQRVEHYEISAYGTARAMAQIMGHGDGDAARANDEEDMGD